MPCPAVLRRAALGHRRWGSRARSQAPPLCHPRSGSLCAAAHQGTPTPRTNLWAPPNPRHAGKYSDSYPGYNKNVYGSSSYYDKLFLAAAWLYRATGARGSSPGPGARAGAGHASAAPLHTQLLGGCGASARPARRTPGGCPPAAAHPCLLNPRPLPPHVSLDPAGQDAYNQDAHAWYSKLGGRWDISVYVSWDDVSAPAAMAMLMCARWTLLRSCCALVLPCCALLRPPRCTCCALLGLAVPRVPSPQAAHPARSDEPPPPARPRPAGLPRSGGRAASRGWQSTSPSWPTRLSRPGSRQMVRSNPPLTITLVCLLHRCCRRRLRLPQGAAPARWQERLSLACLPALPHPADAGSWAIHATPGGMRYMTWSGGWGNLRYANNAALVALAWAAQQPRGAVRGWGGGAAAGSWAGGQGGRGAGQSGRAGRQGGG